MALSLVLDAFRKQANQQQQRGGQTPQTGRGPTLPGVARGTMGVTGSRAFQARNPDASLTKSREQLRESPIMAALLRRKKKRLL